MMQLFSPTEAVTMAAFNQRFSDIWSALPSQNLKIATGTYTGTGTGGAGQPTSLTFNFAPKILIITRPDNVYNSLMVCIAGCAYAGSCSLYYTSTVPFNGRNIVTFSNGGKTIQWYSDNYSIASDLAAAQLNSSRTTYQYFAIGM